MRVHLSKINLHRAIAAVVTAGAALNLGAAPAHAGTLVKIVLPPALIASAHNMAYNPVNSRGIDLQGLRFGAYAPISIEAYDTATGLPLPMVTTQADANGNFATTIQAPISQMRYCGFSCGFTSNINVRAVRSGWPWPTYTSAWQTVTVQRAWTSSYVNLFPMIVSENQPVPPTMMGVRGYGFTPGADVRVDLINPSGQELRGAGWAKADANGNFLVSFVWPQAFGYGSSTRTLQYSQPQFFIDWRKIGFVD